MPATKKTQKLVPSRTKISRRARAIRRAVLALQTEVEFFRENPSETTPDELAKLEKRYERAKARFVEFKSHRAAKLEVPAALALAEMEDEENGEDE